MNTANYTRVTSLTSRKGGYLLQGIEKSSGHLKITSHRDHNLHSAIIAIWREEDPQEVQPMYFADEIEPEIETRLNK